MALGRSWQALLRNPWMVLFPVGWDLLVWGATALTVSSLPQDAAKKVSVKFLLPPAMPAGGDLFDGSTSSAGASLGAVALIVLIMLLSAPVKAGYLHVMAGALRGEETGWSRFIEGAKYYGGRMLLWHLLLAVVMGVALLLALPLRAAALLLIIPGILAAFAFYLTDFLLVVSDMELGEALRAAPGMLAAHFGRLLQVGLTSVGVSAVLSLILSSVGLQTVFAASPLWGWFGTWVGMAVVAVISSPVPEIE